MDVGRATMSINLNRILRDIANHNAAADSRQLPTPQTSREPSTTEKAQPWLPVNYGLLFCPHGKSYFDVCSNCRRTRKDAQRQFQAFQTRYGVE